MIIFGLVARVANAFHAGTNATLEKSLNPPFLAALFLVGTGALALAATRQVSGRLDATSTSSTRVSR